MNVLSAFLFLNFLTFPINLHRSLCLPLLFLHVCVIYLLQLHFFCDVMANYFADLFILTSLTEGHSARDLPKQHPAKKTKGSKTT